jgi:hypothetical protein
MHNELTRRFFFGAAAGAAAGGPLLFGQELKAPGTVVHEPVFPVTRRSTVAVIPGKERRQMVTDALVAIEYSIQKPRPRHPNAAGEEDREALKKTARRRR